MRIAQVFFLFGCLGTFSRAQDDCFSCVLGNALQMFTAENVIKGITFTGGVLKGFFEPSEQAIADPALGLLDVPLQPITLPAPGTQTTPQDPNLAIPDTQFNVDTPDAPPKGLPGDDNCDPEKPVGTLLQPGIFCAVATAQIVWPPACGDAGRNAKILATLIALAPPGGVRTFTDKCGTFFWTATLTQEQIENLMAKNLGIQHIVPDGVGTVNNKFSSRVQRRTKRHVPVVDVQSPASDNLAYFSTPPGAQNAGKSYASVKNVGEGITVYHLDISADLPSRELTMFGVFKRVLLAEDVDQDEWFGTGGHPRPFGWGEYDRTSSSDHGGCMLSLIGGGTLGVTRRANLIMVKYRLSDSSLLSALDIVLQDLSQREIAGEQVKGKTVISAAASHPWNSYHYIGDRVNEKRGGAKIRRMIEKYQVVFVNAAGNTREGDPLEGDINSWPPSLAENVDIPIITVGALNMHDGMLFPFSKRGPLLTITAPGHYDCFERGKVRRKEGTSGAAAMVSGAVADILSRQYLRDYLALQENEGDYNPQLPTVAVKVRDYLTSKAYERVVGGPSVIWNGLYPNDPTRVEP